MDEFRREVERIAARANGEKKTIDDVFSLVLAADHDTHARFKALEGMFEAHCDEATDRDRRLEALEAAVESCPDRWDEKHGHLHDDHLHKFHSERRAGDAKGTDFSESREGDGEEIRRKVWVIWGVGIFIAVAVSNVLISFVLNSAIGR